MPSASARDAEPDRLRGLDELLRHLRLAGLPIYPRDIERLQKACSAGVSTERKRFYALLRCTLAKNPREEAVLSEQFQQWWESGSQWVDAVEQVEEQREQPLDAPRNTIEATRETHGLTRHPAVTASSPAQRWRDRRSWKHGLAKRGRQGWTGAKRWLLRSQPYATLASIALIGVVLVFWFYHPEPEHPLRPADRVAAQTPQPPGPSAPDFQPASRYYSWIPQAVQAVGKDFTLPILLALLLASLPLGYLVWYRYKYSSSPPPAAARAQWKGPAWRPLLPQHQELALLHPKELLHGAWAVENFVAEEPTRRLDVTETVAATCREGGIPVLRYQRARYPKAIWLWCDRERERADAERLVAELQQGLTRLALPVQSADFWGSPTELYNETGKPFSPLDLEGRREQVWLFVITDGRRLRSRLGAALEGPVLGNVLRALSLWPQLAFVDSGRGEFDLAGTLAPFAIDCIEPEQLIARLSGLVQPPSGLTPQLRNQLRSWQAAACLGRDPVSWDTARALLQALALPGLTPWHFPALATTAGQVPGGLGWSRTDRLQTLDWLAHAQTFNPKQLVRSDLGRALVFWRDHYRQEMTRRAQNEDDSLNPWTNSPGQLRIRMELGFLDLWDCPNEAAQRLYALFANPLFHDQVKARFKDYTDRNGNRKTPRAKDHTDGNGHREAPPIRLPWAWEELKGRSRRLLQDMGFEPPPGGRVAPRLSGGLVMPAAFMLGLLAIGGYRLGQLGYLMAPVIPDDKLFNEKVFRSQVIADTSKAGIDTQLVVGSAKHLSLTTAKPLQRFKVTWSGGWGGKDDAGYPNPVASEEAGGSIWYAGTLAQPIRGCEKGWPRRSLVVLDTQPGNPAAQRLAAALLDKGSADKVLIGTAWNKQLTGFQELPVALTGPDQLLVVTDRDSLPPVFAGAVAIVRLDEMSQARLDGLREGLTFEGVDAIGDRWGKLAGVVSIVGEGVKLRGGPEVSRDEESGLSFVRICGGTFTMGSSKERSQPHREKDLKEYADQKEIVKEIYDSESTPHAVTLAAFELTQTEITNAQYQRCQDDWRYENGTANHPVVNLNWNQAKSCCEKFGYRLPTEAEWEYAARGGSQSAWHFGDDETRLADYGWYRANSERKAHEVRMLQENALGLYDMAGNVWEWVADCFRADAYQDRPRTVSVAPSEDSIQCKRRVVRGGSAWINPRFLRSADRLRRQPVLRREDLGFRCVRAPAASD